MYLLFIPPDSGLPSSRAKNGVGFKVRGLEAQWRGTKEWRDSVEGIEHCRLLDRLGLWSWYDEGQPDLPNGEKLCAL